MSEQTLKETLNLPKTAFPMKAELVRREQERLQKWDEGRLYEKIQEKNSNHPRFLLHDADFRRRTSLDGTVTDCRLSTKSPKNSRSC